MEKLIPIRDAAEMLGVTTTTLRRWDAAGKLKSVRAGEGGHRLYRKKDLDLFINDLSSTARNWASAALGEEPSPDYYCQNSAIFNLKLSEMDELLSEIEGIEEFKSLIVAVTGEIGNNSFDHNLGSWPDVPGIFFAYDLNKKHVVLADRGVGILSTLQRVRPSLKTHGEALKVAFTERITGRAPESRGNGLKFVKKVISEYPLSMEFQTGNAEIEMQTGNNEIINVVNSELTYQGCFASIKF